jgi:hypothetical protein
VRQTPILERVTSRTPPYLDIGESFDGRGKPR